MPFAPAPLASINAKFLLAHPAHFIALGLGSGLSPKAPGTVGTLWAWLAWLLLQNVLSPSQQGVVILLATLLGWWAAKVTTQNLGIADPGAIVWDEVVAFWLVLWLLMPSNPLLWAGRIRFSKASAGAVLGAFISTTLLRPCARCW